MARLRRKDLKNVTVLHPWGAPRLDLTAVFCPETSTSDFFFRRRNQTFILEDKLNVFSIGRIIGYYEKNGLWSHAVLAFQGAKSCLYS